MTTPIEDSELNTELQELYLKSKQWLSDLEFTHTEIEFIKVLLLKGGNDPELLIQTADIHNNLLQLQNSISEFMHQLESIIIKEIQVMDMSLLETYTKLLYRHEGILQAFNSLKGTVFGSNKHQVK